MAQWLRRPTVETLVFTGSSPALAKKLFFAKNNSNTDIVHFAFQVNKTMVYYVVLGRYIFFRV